MSRFFCRVTTRFINLTTLCFLVYQVVSTFLQCTTNYPINSGPLQTIKESYSSTTNNSRSQFKLMGQELFEYMASFLNKKNYPGISIYTDYMVARLGKQPLPNIQPLLPGLIPVLNDITSYRYSLSVNPCQVNSSVKELSLFVAVISAPSNVIKRQAIRKTWLQVLSSELNSIRIKHSSTLAITGVAFVVGRSQSQTVNDDVNKESANYKDILQIDTADSYYNITTKVVGLLNWLNRKCSDVDFVLKVDDDVYVNVRNFGSFVRKLDVHRFPGVYGVLTQHKVPQRGKKKTQSYLRNSYTVLFYF